MEILAGIISLIILIYFIIKIGQIASNTSEQVDYLRKIHLLLEKPSSAKPKSSSQSNLEKMSNNDFESMFKPQQHVQIENLRALMEEGHITEAEFEEDKKKILGS